MEPQERSVRLGRETEKVTKKARTYNPMSSRKPQPYAVKNAIALAGTAQFHLLVYSIFTHAAISSNSNHAWRAMLVL